MILNKLKDLKGELWRYVRRSAANIFSVGTGGVSTVLVSLRVKTHLANLSKLRRKFFSHVLGKVISKI